MRDPFNHRIFTPMAGGLGDILTYYLEGELGYFPALQARGYATKVVAYSESNQITSLFALNPHIDRLVTPSFAPVAKLTDGFRSYAQSVEPEWALMTPELRATLPWHQPEFFLTHHEKGMAFDILAGAPYIAVHPFAGGVERMLPPGMLEEIVETAAQHTRVVVLGGNSIRNGHLTRELTEHYGSPFRKNVLNLVNMYSVRLQAQAVRGAAKFIGTVSAYNCVAQHFRTPSLIFGSAGNRKSMLSGAGSVFAKMRDNGVTIRYLDERPDVKNLVREFCHGGACTGIR